MIDYEERVLYVKRNVHSDKKVIQKKIATTSFFSYGDLMRHEIVTVYPLH